MAPTDRFVSETSFRVRYAETDAMGIVHHSSYVVYFEEGRSHFSRVRNVDYAEFEKAGYALTVVEVHARYRVPARYPELLTIRCWLEQLHSRSLTFGYEVVAAETQTVLVTGQTKHVCVTREGQVTALPVEWRRALSETLLTEESEK